MPVVVEVFKSNISTKETAYQFMDHLSEKLTSADIYVDMEDCDHIVRIASEKDVNLQIIEQCAAQDGIILERLN